MTYQCYYTENGKRCPKEQDDYWCSPEHKAIWQQENYGSKEQQRTIERIREMRRLDTQKRAIVTKE